MNIAVNTWIFDPRLQLHDRINLLALGCKGIEINFEEGVGSLLGWATSLQELKKMKGQLLDRQITVSSICTELFWKYSLTSDSKSEQRIAVELGKRMIDYAAYFDARSIVVIPGIVKAPTRLRVQQNVVPQHTAWERAKESILLLSEYSEGSGAVIGIENVHYNHFLISPEQTLRFLQEVDHRLVKAHLDIGNAQIAGNAKDWIQTLCTHIFAIHVKDLIETNDGNFKFVPLGRGSIRWDEIIESLKVINYRGFLIIEQSFSANEDFMHVSDCLVQSMEILKINGKET